MPWNEETPQPLANLQYGDGYDVVSVERVEDLWKGKCSSSSSPASLRIIEMGTKFSVSFGIQNYVHSLFFKGPCGVGAGHPRVDP